VAVVAVVDVDDLAPFDSNCAVDADRFEHVLDRNSLEREDPVAIEVEFDRRVAVDRNGCGAGRIGG
jgi:hypothetical protein